jgi:hypothetical protein
MDFLTKKQRAANAVADVFKPNYAKEIPKTKKKRVLIQATKIPEKEVVMAAASPMLKKQRATDAVAALIKQRQPQPLQMLPIKVASPLKQRTSGMDSATKKHRALAIKRWREKRDRKWGVAKKQIECDDGWAVNTQTNRCKKMCNRSQKTGRCLTQQTKTRRLSSREASASAKKKIRKSSQSSTKKIKINKKKNKKVDEAEFTKEDGDDDDEEEDRDDDINKIPGWQVKTMDSLLKPKRKKKRRLKKFIKPKPQN